MLPQNTFIRILGFQKIKGNRTTIVQKQKIMAFFSFFQPSKGMSVSNLMKWFHSMVYSHSLLKSNSNLVVSLSSYKFVKINKMVRLILVKVDFIIYASF